jgi:mono/diheme cytochrome c family protein
MRTIVFVTLLSSLVVLAQDKQIKPVTVSRTSAGSGKEMFGAYCAPCHGLDGTGNGPAASALKKTPADLTALASKNGGKFPSAHVFATLKQVDSPVHGSKEMPVWGTLLSSVSSSEAETQLRMNNLVSYVQSMQKP